MKFSLIKNAFIRLDKMDNVAHLFIHFTVSFKCGHAPFWGPTQTLIIPIKAASQLTPLNKRHCTVPHQLTNNYFSNGFI